MDDTKIIIGYAPTRKMYLMPMIQLNIKVSNKKSV